MNDKIAKVGTIYCNQETKEIFLKPEEKKYFQDINVVMKICPNCLRLATVQSEMETNFFNNIKKFEYKCRNCGFTYVVK